RNATPPERRSYSVNGDRPKRIQRQRHVITATRVIQNVRCLIDAPGPAAIVRRAQSHDSLVVYVEKFPIKFRAKRTSAVTNCRGSKKAGKLPANLFLLAQ